jgi:hypothetical protein
LAQARIGHASASETLETYSHLWPDSNDLTRAAVDAILGAPADSLRTEQATERIPAGQRLASGAKRISAG